MAQYDIKAVFFDVDGTLISHRKHAVPVSTIRVIARLRKQGILTFVATGRHPIELKKLLPESLEFDAYLCLMECIALIIVKSLVQSQFHKMI